MSPSIEDDNDMDIQEAIHILASSSSCRIATAHDVVHNSECVYTFHTPYTTTRGIVVNLQTFIGTVDEYAFQRDQDSSSSFNNRDEATGLFVRIVKQRIAVTDNHTISSTAGAVNEEGHGVDDTLLLPASVATQFITKLGIGIEGGFPSDDQKYDTICTYSIVLLRKLQNGTVVSMMEIPFDPNHRTVDSDDSVVANATRITLPSVVRQSANSIIYHTGTAIQQDLMVWELDQEPKPISKYADQLPFVNNGVTISPQASDWKVGKQDCGIIGSFKNSYHSHKDLFLT